MICLFFFCKISLYVLINKIHSPDDRNKFYPRSLTAALELHDDYYVNLIERYIHNTLINSSYRLIDCKSVGFETWLAVTYERAGGPQRPTWRRTSLRVWTLDFHNRTYVELILPLIRACSWDDDVGQYWQMIQHLPTFCRLNPQFLTYRRC